jgi:hypothetical protein
MYMRNTMYIFQIAVYTLLAIYVVKSKLLLGKRQYVLQLIEGRLLNCRLEPAGYRWQRLEPLPNGGIYNIWLAGAIISCSAIDIANAG